MAPVLSFIIFLASENFVQHRENYRKALEAILAIHGSGLTSFYDGLQAEEEGAKHGYLVSLWNSPEQLETFFAVAGQIFDGILAAVSAGELNRYQFIPVHRLPTPALNYKFTEYAISWPKAGVSSEAVKEAANKVSDTVEAVGHPSAVGESPDGKFLFIAGWDSVAQHQEVTKNEPFPTVLGAFAQVADFDAPGHARLEKLSIQFGTRLL